MADYSTLSDDELLALTRREPEAFAVFYRRHARAVFRFVGRSTRSAEAALDLTAEVFAAALAGSRRFRPGEAPAEAWLFGIARNKLAAARRDEWRASATRRKLGMAELRFSDEDIARAEELLDLQDDAYTAGLSQLSPGERDAVRARVIEERSYREIASTNGTSEAAVRQRVSRGLARLAKIGKRGDR